MRRASTSSLAKDQRVREALHLRSRGYSIKDIAQKLGVSRWAVSGYFQSIAQENARRAGETMQEVIRRFLDGEDVTTIAEEMHLDQELIRTGLQQYPLYREQERQWWQRYEDLEERLARLELRLRLPARNFAVKVPEWHVSPDLEMSLRHARQKYLHKECS